MNWPEIRKSETPPFEFCPISGYWGELGIQKFGTNVSNEMLLSATICQGYSFYIFWVIKGKPTGGKVKLPSSQIRVNLLFLLVALQTHCIIF